MKINSLLIILAIALTSCASSGKLVKEGVVLIEGSDLYYKVTVGSDLYNFDININQFSDQLISFDWELGSTQNGAISMNETALANATELHNYFSSGYLKLENITSVWVSKFVFDELKKGNSVEINLGRGVKETFKLSGSKTYSFGNKGDDVPYNIPIIIAKSTTTEKEIWIANDKNNRLIVKMELDFSINLNDFKPYN